MLLVNKKADGWQAILRKRGLYKVHPDVKFKENSDDRLPNTEVNKDSLNLPDYNLNYGHLLADSFIRKARKGKKSKISNLMLIEKYERSKCARNKTSFASLDNLDNIYLQFQAANNVQENFEDSVLNIFNENQDKNLEVYYEVQPVFLNTNDAVPIGNRIFACTNYYANFNYGPKIQENWKLPFHVFVPNVDSNIEIKNNYNWRDFFKTGDPNYLIKKKNIN